MTNNKQQTAVQWFAFELSKLGLLPDGVPDDIYKQAKEMEKERIMKAHISAGARLEDISIEAAEEYYNETYGGNK
jgi:hypothetical protein